MTDFATSISVSGLHGTLILIAVILFAVAAIAAWAIPPKARWATAVAAGLCLWALAALVSG